MHFQRRKPSIIGCILVMMVLCQRYIENKESLAFQPRKDALQATKSKMKRKRDKKEVTEIDASQVRLHVP